MAFCCAALLNRKPGTRATRATDDGLNSHG
jgi:hypothetical protein